MKAVRVVQILFIALLAGYLVLLHNANPTGILLPFLLPLPPALVIALGLLLGWLAGWLPGRVAVWRKNRDVRRLARRVEELERRAPTYALDHEPSAPVIPDRGSLSESALDRQRTPGEPQNRETEHT